MIIIDKNAKREVQVKYPDRTRVLFPNLDDGYISSNDIVVPSINAPISDDGVSVATINDGAEGGAISKLVIGIEPVQDLHGQSNPYPAGGGKNLYNASDISGQTEAHNGITCTVSNGEITLNGTATGNAYFTVYNLDLPAGNYVASFNNPVANSGVKYSFKDLDNQYFSDGALSSTNKTETLTNKSIKNMLIYVLNETVLSNFKVKPQLEVGSTATAWSPYSNICPISGWTEAKVTRYGINIWDEDWERGVWNGSGGKTPSNTAIRSKNYIPVTPSTTYYLKFPSRYTSGLIIRELDKNKGFLTTTTKETAGTFTVGSGCYFIVMCTYGSDNITTYNNDISINYPSTDTAYHAYNGQQYTIDLDGTRYGGTLDVTTGVLKVDRAMWTASASNLLRSSDNSFYSTAVDNIAYSTSENTTTAISDTFKSNTTNNTDCVFINTQGRIQVNTSTGYSSVANLISGVGTFKVLYQLATPITVQLTPQEVTTILGQNNIWADCGNVLELSYSANMNIRLQDLLDEKLDKPTTPGTLGQVLTSDGEGGQTWETPE